MKEIEKGENKTQQEAALWRSLHHWTEEAKQQKKEEYASHLIELASLRFERRQEVDVFLNDWLREAGEILPEDDCLQQLRFEDALVQLREEALIPRSWPLLRETDQPKMKKQVVNQLNEQAHAFLQEYNRVIMLFPKEVFKSQESLNGRMKQAYSLKRQFEDFKELHEELAHVTDELLQSFQGIHFARSYFVRLRALLGKAEEKTELWYQTVESLLGETEAPTALQQLGEMIGLHTVKQRVRDMYSFLAYQQARREKGLQTKSLLNLNMILTGNPGTGKTTLARLIATIYYELGLLKKPEVWEVDRSQLVAGYVGQTEEQTIAAIERASGGVLFIDEAYSLKREGQAGNDYGQAAIDTLVAAMTSGAYAGNFAVVLAGYPKEMRAFLRSNPGLRSRFPEQNQLHLPNYNTKELLQIAEKLAVENDFVFTQEALPAIEARIEKAQVDDTFGNARTVHSIVTDAIFDKGARGKNSDEENLILLRADHVKNETGEQKRKALLELDELIGLETVKTELKKLTAFAEVKERRRRLGEKMLPMPLHTVFTGPPGTGKTTVAKLYARALHEIGLLKRGHLVTATRVDLVSGYMGQTAIKTEQVIQDALGGVLFIDEAYSLAQGGANDFGDESLTALISAMTAHEENLVVIFAGYQKEMNALLAKNRGLSSRVRKEIVFPSYSAGELFAMLEARTKRFGYTWTKEGLKAAKKAIPPQGHSGNGRFVSLFMEMLAVEQAVRVRENDIPGEEFLQLNEEDVKQARQAVEKQG
ncbi:AAA family ATPase [Shouchella shacheensis]|uniref:AAA family ATPase n=1 Tax=Shouchella shacheensis TaxID=1649580 RepID=UPI00073FE243|nr:AAA family ATPase [Shouchella shacheensis]